jgi:hypothetical protein
MDDLHYEVMPPTLALPGISERDKGRLEPSSSMAPLAAFAIYLITSLPILAHLIQCAPTARFTSGGRIHPGSCR